MKWTAAVVGDVMLDRKPKEASSLTVLKEADFASANLETPFADNGHPADKHVVIRAPREAAVHLASIGLDVVSFANNHALDYGIPAFASSIEAVEAAGVRVIGAGHEPEEALRPIVTERSGVKVAWLAFASTLPAGFAVAPGRPGVAPIRVESSIILDAAMIDEQPGTSPFVATRVYEEDLERATHAVKLAGQAADVVIVHIHWGVPPGFAAGFQGTLAQYQRPLAHALVEAGANVILGHHPHCLHGIEVVQRSIVLYSVGHFIFHALAANQTIVVTRPGPPYWIEAMMVPQFRETSIFQLHFEDASLKQLEVVPCVLNDEGESEIASGRRAASILEWLRERSKECGSNLEVESERGFLHV